jgi:hypothetical protein
VALPRRLEGLEDAVSNARRDMLYKFYFDLLGVFAVCSKRLATWESFNDLLFHSMQVYANEAYP